MAANQAHEHPGGVDLCCFWHWTMAFHTTPIQRTCWPAAQRVKSNSLFSMEIKHHDFKMTSSGLWVDNDGFLPHSYRHQSMHAMVENACSTHTSDASRAVWPEEMRLRYGRVHMEALGPMFPGASTPAQKTAPGSGSCTSSNGICRS